MSISIASMTSDEVFEVIKRVGETSSKNEKQAILAEHKEDHLMRHVLYYALNPFYTYGVAKRPVFDGPYTSYSFDDDTWNLLIDLAERKLTGNAAIAAIKEEMSTLSEESAELLWRIIAKDLRAGFGDSTVNKVIKGFIPDSTYMRCSLPTDTDLSKWDWANGIISQEKADAMFANIDHDHAGIVTLTTRPGNPFPMDKFERIAKEVQENIPLDTRMHGEIIVVVDGELAERSVSNGIMNRVISGGDFLENEYPILKVWDIIPLECVVPKGKYETEYQHRLVTLLKALPKETKNERVVNVIDTRIVRSLKEAYAHYKEMLLLGKEGTVIKKKTLIWKDGTSKDQVKLKLDFECDLVVTEILQGKDGKRTENRPGSLRCMTSDYLLVVDVAIKNEAMRDDVEAFPEKWLGGIMSVIANEVLTPSESNEMHTLFLPRFAEACLRDKSTADDLARVFAQYEAAKEGK